MKNMETFSSQYHQQPSLGWDLFYVFFFCHIKAASKKGWKVKSHSLPVNWSFVSASFFGQKASSHAFLTEHISLIDDFPSIHWVLMAFQGPLSSRADIPRQAPVTCGMMDLEDSPSRRMVGNAMGGTCFFLRAWLKWLKRPQKILEISGCGCVTENVVSTPKNPMVLLIIIPMKNG